MQQFIPVIAAALAVACGLMGLGAALPPSNERDQGSAIVLILAALVLAFVAGATS